MSSRYLKTRQYHYSKEVPRSDVRDVSVWVPRLQRRNQFAGVPSWDVFIVASMVRNVRNDGNTTMAGKDTREWPK